jgi:hypothetical protein
MDMPRLVTAAPVIRRAAIEIFRAHLDDVLIHVIAVRMMEMAIVQIVDVVAVANCCVAAARTVLVVVIRVMQEIAGAHRVFPFRLTGVRSHAPQRFRSCSGRGCR